MAKQIEVRVRHADDPGEDYSYGVSITDDGDVIVPSIASFARSPVRRWLEEQILPLLHGADGTVIIIDKDNVTETTVDITTLR